MVRKWNHVKDAVTQEKSQLLRSHPATGRAVLLSSAQGRSVRGTAGGAAPPSQLHSGRAALVGTAAVQPLPSAAEHKSRAGDKVLTWPAGTAKPKLGTFPSDTEQ